MMRGAHKQNGRYIFIPAASANEANLRRAQSIKRLNELKAEMKLLSAEHADLLIEIQMLNSTLRGLAEKS